ncbi:hypothetical protein [Luedemannella helvata]
MGDGTGYANEMLDPQAFAAASEACGYFGLNELADLIKRIAVMNDGDELERATREYGRLVPFDQVLGDAFDRRFVVAPDDFDPVDA